MDSAWPFGAHSFREVCKRESMNMGGSRERIVWREGGSVSIGIEVSEEGFVMAVVDADDVEVYTVVLSVIRRRSHFLRMFAIES